MSASIAVPAGPGVARAHIGYLNAEDVADNGQEVERWNFMVGYTMDLSKRTSIYATAAYLVDSLKSDKYGDRDPRGTEFQLGMIHKF